MTKKNKNKKFSTKKINMQNRGNNIISFSNNVLPVKENIINYMEEDFVGSVDYISPPISFDFLSDCLHTSAFHESAIKSKANLLSSFFQSNKFLSYLDFKSAVLDYLIFGNCFFKKQRSKLKNIVKLKHIHAMRTRINKNGDYVFIKNYQENLTINKKNMVHVFEPYHNNCYYGAPEYISAIQSALLNESATLFRRKYYENGSHAGFILYLSDEEVDQDSFDNLAKALEESKGSGNFKNYLIKGGSGNANGIKMLPISETVAKDEFANIKNISREDILASHRVQPQLIGVVPNKGTLGNTEQAKKAFIDMEIEPLKRNFLQVNEHLSIDVIKFKN